MKIYGSTIIILSLFLSSCAFHTGLMTSGTTVVHHPNFAIIGYGTGYAETTHILGIGGLDKNALVHEAKKNLYKNHPLKPGQALGQTSVDFKKSFFLLVINTKVFVSAEIIQLYEPPATEEILLESREFWEGNYTGPKESRLGPLIEGTNFREGETVKFKPTQEKFHGAIMEGKVKERNGKFLVIFYVDSKGSEKGLNVPMENVFKVDPEDKK